MAIMTYACGSIIRVNPWPSRKPANVDAQDRKEAPKPTKIKVRRGGKIVRTILVQR